jgi:hypothetical protein
MQVTEVLELTLVQKRLLNTALGAVRLRRPAPGNIKTEALQKHIESLGKLKTQ